MAITKPILGKWITLRCAEESDAEFTLAIRNDLKLTKFIPKVNGDIESQKYWIRKQREKYGDYFFNEFILNGISFAGSPYVNHHLNSLYYEKNSFTHRIGGYRFGRECSSPEGGFR